MDFRKLDTPEQLRAECESIFHDAWRVNQRKQTKMRTYMAFFRGLQHAIDLGPNLDDPLTVDDRVAFEVVQLTRPTLRQETATFLNTIPTMDPIPSQSGVVAKMRAKATARVCNSRLRCYPEFFQALYDARLSASIYGASWIKQYWDPYKFRNNQMMGDAAWQFTSILDAFPDYRATNEQNLRYICHRRAIPKESAESWWPQDFEGKPTDGKFAPLSLRNSNISGQELEAYYTRGYGTQKQNALCEVNELWFKPSASLPLGALIVWSGGMLIHVAMDEQTGQLALPDGVWPWVLINGLNKVPDKLYADGLLPDLIPLQITTNFLASKLRESTAQAAQATLVTSRDAEIGEGSVDNMSGTILEVTGDVRRALAWNQGPGPQSGVMSYTELTMDWWNRASTMVDASRGITNGQANAKLLSFQQELGDSTHAPDRIMWGNQVATLLKNDNRITHSHYDQGRYLRILGPNGAPETISFNAEDYDPDADFIFDPMNSPPTNRELAEQKIMEAMQMGVLEDTPSAKRARAMIRRFQDGSDTRDPKEAHRDRVMLEQVQFVMYGQVPQVLDRDDDSVHLEEDEIFTVSPEFLSMPMELQEQYLQHMVTHQINYAMKQQGLAAQSQEAQPMSGPGTPGQPSQNGTGGPTGGKRKGVESPASGGSSAYPDTVSKEPSAYGQDS